MSCQTPITCPNCGADAKKVWVEREDGGTEVAKIYLAVATCGWSLLSKKLSPQARWGNKLACRECGYEEWL